MDLRKLVALLVVCLSCEANAQDPDAELRKYREDARARTEAREQEQLKNLSVEDADKFKRLKAASMLSRRHINGKETPDLVPYHVRMQHFFQSYERGTFRQQLEKQLSPADLVVLDAFAQRYREELKKAGAAYQNDWTQIYSQAQSMSAIEIAGLLKAASDRTYAAQSAVYQAGIRQLTPDGQKVVNDFAFARVRPQLSIWDPLPEAAAEPELYKEQIVKFYELYSRGALPKRSPAQDGLFNSFSEEGAQLGGP